MSVKNNGNSAATAADNDFICIHKTVDRILFNDFNRLWRCNYTTITTPCVFFHDMSICLGLMVCFLFCQEFADRLGWIFKSRIIGIYTNLSDNSDDRCADKSSDSKFLSQSILQIISDVSLTHGNTDRERSVWLILIFSGESRHGIVDHANLWPVSMYNNNLMTFFDQIA